MMLINPGKYDKLVTFYSKTLDNSGTRAPSYSWTKTATKRARVWSASRDKRKDDELGAVDEDAQYIAELRYDSAITTDMVWRYKGIDINVDQIINKNEEDKEMLIKGYRSDALNLTEA